MKARISVGLSGRGRSDAFDESRELVAEPLCHVQVEANASCDVVLNLRFPVGLDDDLAVDECQVDQAPVKSEPQTAGGGDDTGFIGIPEPSRNHADRLNTDWRDGPVGSLINRVSVSHPYSPERQVDVERLFIQPSITCSIQADGSSLCKDQSGREWIVSAASLPCTHEARP